MDPIANMLTQIRNSQAVGAKSCLASFSKIKEEIVKILKEENYVRNYRVEERDGKKNIRISLAYDKSMQPAIRSIKRVSKPGRRIYCSKEKLPIVLRGLGMVIVSTNKGIMTGRSATRAGVGGEIICEIY